MKRFILALTLFVSHAHAHHGLDFLLVNDASQPSPFTGMIFGNAEWSSTDGQQSWETETGVHFGLTPWLAVGAMAGINDEGEGFQYDSITPHVNVPLFQSDSVPWLRVSLFAGYSFPDSQTNSAAPASSSSRRKNTSAKSKGATYASSAAASQPSSGNRKATAPGTSSKSASTSAKPYTASSKSNKHTTGGGGGTGPDAPTHDHPTSAAPAAPPPQSDTPAEPVIEPIPVFIPEPVHEHTGIHRHGDEGLVARLIVDMRLGEQDKLVLNLINFTPSQGRPGWGYAAGFRHEFSHEFATSLEAIGDFDEKGYHEALISAFWSPIHYLTLKVGVGAGLTESSPDIAAHAGVVLRF